MNKSKRTILFPLLFLICGALLCGCVSKIKLGDSKFPADSETVSAVIQAGETEKLAGFGQLKSADLSGSTCYEEIAAWAEAHPDTAVRYTVSFPEGSVVDNYAETLDLSALEPSQIPEALELLKWLPALQNVDLGSESGGLSAEDVAGFVSAYPQSKFDFSVKLLGKSCSLAKKILDLSGIGHSQAEELLEWLPCMTRLDTVDLGDDSAESGGLKWEDISAFQQACPNAVFEYDFSLYGMSFSLTDSAVDLNHVTVDDEGALVLRAAKCMPSLTYLDMDFCGVSDESMAAIRDALPQVEVVWRIWFGEKYSVRTNVETILASNPGLGGELTGENTQSLMYCTKVKCLDLGHNSFLNDISFVQYMPDLEVLIVAMANWNDASALAYCPKLEYAEIQTSALNDLSPLSGLKNLRHLNIAYCFALHDISPIYDLDLDRLWIGYLTPIPQAQLETIQEKHPDCEINTTTFNPTEEGWRYLGENAYGVMELAPRYALLREQFRYSEKPYAYYWNDPLYNPHN